MPRELNINNISAIEVLDSRGNPTIQVDVETQNGYVGRAIVPSGASTGSFEATELRDNDKNRYLGKGVLEAVNNVNKKIASKLIGKNVYNQQKIDEMLVELDGTENKSKLGANAILATSLAVCKAAAKSLNIELYNYIGGINARRLPMPMMNILNGGKHSDNNLSIQEFMIVPVGAKSFTGCMQIGTEVYHNLRKVLKEKGYNVSVGDEGGFAPNLESEKQALDLIVEAIDRAGYQPKTDVAIALDVAATEMYDEAKKANKNGSYYFWKTRKPKIKR